jgi:hypothetical protein
MENILVVFHNVKVVPGDTNFLKNELNKTIGWSNDLLHNHTPQGGYIYRYPRIQYRSHNGKAAICCIGEGVQIIRALLENPRLPKAFRLNYQVFGSQNSEIRMVETPIIYTVNNFIPFSADNFNIWSEIESLVAKLEFMEQKIANHILEFCDNFKFEIPKRNLTVSILDWQNVEMADIKKLKMDTFDIKFKANISLPQFIGLGRYKSMGNGIVNTKIETKLNTRTPKRVLELV